VRSRLPIQETLADLRRRGRGPTAVDPVVLRKLEEESSASELWSAAGVLGLAASFLWFVQKGQFLLMGDEDEGEESGSEQGKGNGKSQTKDGDEGYDDDDDDDDDDDNDD
jgi:hypothetical protein